MGAVRLIAARCKARGGGRSPRRYSVDLLPGYAVGEKRRLDVAYALLEYSCRIRHLDPVFLVSFRASPVPSVVRGSFFVKQ